MNEVLGKYVLVNGLHETVEKFNTNWIYEGVAVYEVFRVMDGIPLFWEDHYQRLKNSLKLAKEAIPYEREEVEKMLMLLFQVNDFRNGNVKLVYNLTSLVFLIYLVQHRYPEINDYRNGVKTITLVAERNTPNAKILNQQLRDEANRLIRKNQVFEVLLVNEEGNITEGSRSNLFVISKSKVITPPVETVLPGITRKYVLNICRELGLIVDETTIPVSELPNLDGLFITGTSPKVLPVIQINDFKFNFENIMLKRIMDRYNDYILKYIRENELHWKKY